MHNVSNPAYPLHEVAILHYQTVKANGKLDYHHAEISRPDRYVSKNTGFIDGTWLVCGNDANPPALVAITFLDVAGSEAFRRELVVAFENTNNAQAWLKKLDLLQSTRIHRL